MSYKIHVYSSGELGIFANAFLIETNNGIVVIDSTLTVSESKSLKARLDAIGKPLLAVILTHPHPDHVAGVTSLVLRHIFLSILLVSSPLIPNTGVLMESADKFRHLANSQSS
jgi:glyoxylase-like metal-dependent hydrolase (beta-lactamase superfamily II)